MDTLQTVIDLLNNDYIRIHIDDPMDNALVNFRYDPSEAMTHPLFNRIITLFVMHVYETAFHVPGKMTSGKAFEEAVWILERGYKSDHAEGYDGAFLDAVDPERGIDSVLATMNEVMKTREQDKYISWVFATHIDPTDWNAHVQITEKIISRFNAELSPTTLAFSSRQVARHYTDLIKKFFSYQKDVNTPLDR